MRSYFSTFITGFGDVVSNELAKQLKDIEIGLLADGLIIYKTSSPLEVIKNLKFLNNSFVLLKKFENVSENSVKEIIKELIKNQNVEKIIKENFKIKGLKFRIRASISNQFVTIDKNILRNFEENILKTSNNLIVDRSLPDIEFLISIRSEGFGLAGIQFTHRPNYEKTLEKGELYPELAYLLCLISEPKKEDIFLDPFAGHGSLPAQRLNFPHKQIVANEINKDLQQMLEKKFSKNIIIKSLDALNLKIFKENSVNKIVTDPPWGFYENQNLDLPKFYLEMLEEFLRVINKNGLIVILTAQKELIKELIIKLKDKLQLLTEHNTLVSGKKAGVYKIKKL
jgi:tRNA G10  N-methylase Trm11